MTTTKIAQAAIEDYKRAKRRCEYKRNHDDYCKMYTERRGHKFCADCPLDYVASIAEVLEEDDPYA